MDLIVIVVNNPQNRKKVKKYLTDIGLDDFIVANSTGGSAFTNNVINLRIDTPFYNSDESNKNTKTIMVINKLMTETEKIIDDVYKIFENGNTNTGIAFSIPLQSV